MSTASSSSSTPKRKRSEASITSSDENASETHFLNWLSSGTTSSSPKDGPEVIDHEEAELRIGGKRVIAHVGDVVYLRAFASSSSVSNSSQKQQQDVDEYASDDVDYYGEQNERMASASIARIERLYETRNASEGAHRKIRARWFLKKKDIADLPEGIQGISGSREDFMNSLNANDVILSDQADDNDVTTIMGLCPLVFRRPSSETPMEGFVCRYRLEIDQSSVTIVPYEGGLDEGGEESQDEDDAPPRKVHRRSASSVDGSKLSRSDASTAASRGTLSSDDEDSDSDERSYQMPGGFPGEGSTEKRDIQVGSKYQVEVPPYQPGLPIRTRNPVQVWKPGQISDHLLNEYLEKVAAILNPFLRDNDLTMDDMYSSLPSDQMEKSLMNHKNPQDNIPTLSSISTSASLSSKRNALLRECDADAVLFVLSQNDYNIPVALVEIQKDPSKYIVHWTRKEKEMFNTGFRRYSGALRMIGKGLAPKKDFRQVNDYHYRFKIPDQFRRFQTKKREQALRMMECIETRRYLNAPIAAPAESGEKPKPKASEWSKTATGDVIGAVENRRVDAKQLLLEVEERLGKEKLAEVADAIKRLHQTSVTELRLHLFDILRGHPDLIQKFVAFLPARFRV